MFLVFGRRFAAVTYQADLETTALGRRRESVLAGGQWYQPGQAARKSFARTLRQRGAELVLRLRDALGSIGVAVSTKVVAAEERMSTIWELSCSLSRHLVEGQEKPRLSCHFIFLALARHPKGARYHLGSA